MSCRYRVCLLAAFLVLPAIALGIAPIDYFPHSVGDHWEYIYAHDIDDGYDRWIYIDTVGDSILGIPGELLSYRQQRAEEMFGGGGVHIFQDTFYSFNEGGDLGATAFNIDGDWFELESLIVMLRNPITVGDEIFHYDLGGVPGLNVHYEVVSISDTLHLTLGDFENCIRYRVEMSMYDTLIETYDDIWIPNSYWPVCGLGAYSGTHFYYEPYAERHFSGRLIGCEVQEPTAVQANPLAAIHLLQNHPNPFNPRTEIDFVIESESDISLRIYDCMGRLARTLMSTVRLGAGMHSRIWDGRDDAGLALPSGVYLCRLESGDWRESRRMILLR